MKIEEFKKKGPLWRKTTPLKTTHGDFDVVLLNGTIDDQMLSLAASASSYLQTNIEHVIDIVLAHYHWVVEQWGRDIVHENDLPEHVDRQNILSCIPERSVTVERLDDEEKPYVCDIAFDVPYDEEHGLQLGFEDGRIKTINEAGFRLENGRLTFEWE